MTPGSPIGLLLVLTFTTPVVVIPNPPIGDPIAPVTWMTGSMPSVTVSTGDGVDSAVWIPGDQI